MKFRRKSQASPEEAPSASAEAVEETPTEPRTGPFDDSEVADDGVERVDLGSLLVAPVPGRELRLQVDEKSGAVRSVLLAGPDGALEFQAFAAPRNGDLWSTVRPQIKDDITRRGGQVTEREGRWGPELLVQMPVKLPDGKTATQPSRIVGVNGSRWMLRASMIGRPALDPNASGEWEDALATIVVRRGSEAMPVGEPLPVKLPDQARRMG